MKRKRSLHLEVLEDRTTPAAFGVPWPDGEHLTVSFVPDGTAAGPETSELFRVLDARFGRAVWQGEVLRALQTWVPHANINFGLVSDDGSPLGASGVVQGDLRFGDVRISAFSMAGVLAVASPFDALGGTWAGDLKLNSDAFALGDVPDLFTVILHESGHSLGLAHSDDPDSPLFEDYSGPRSGPTADDIARLQALYGARQQDSFDALRRNETMGQASPIDHDSGAPRLTADLTTADDVDVYRLPRLGREAATVRVQTAGLSLLAARIVALDANGVQVAAATAGGPGEDLVLSLSPEAAARVRFLRVEKASGVFSVGAYQLEVLQESPAPDSPADPDLGGSQIPVTNLVQRSSRTDSRFDYVSRAELAAPGEVDWYRFLAPRPDDGDNQVMTLMAWATGPSGLLPEIELFDAEGQRIPTEVLINQDGTLVLLLTDAPEGRMLQLSVRDRGDAAGSYFLGIDFSGEAAPLQSFVHDRLLDDPAPEQAGTLHLTESMLVHLVLGAGDDGAGMHLVVKDSANAPVLELTAEAGSTVTATPWLAPGSYTVWVESVGGPDGFLPATYSLSGLGLTDPIGPQPIDVLHTDVVSGMQSPTGATFWWQVGIFTFLMPTGSTSLLTPVTTVEPTTNSTSLTTPVTTVKPTTDLGSELTVFTAPLVLAVPSASDTLQAVPNVVPSISGEPDAEPQGTVTPVQGSQTPTEKAVRPEPRKLVRGTTLVSGQFNDLEADRSAVAQPRTPPSPGESVPDSRTRLVGGPGRWTGLLTASGGGYVAAGDPSAWAASPNSTSGWGGAIQGGVGMSLFGATLGVPDDALPLPPDTGQPSADEALEDTPPSVPSPEPDIILAGSPGGWYGLAPLAVLADAAVLVAIGFGSCGHARRPRRNEARPGLRAPVPGS